MKSFQLTDENYYRLISALSVIFVAFALFVPVMEPDAAIYAEIAREMLVSGNWWALTYDGYEFLDKPHLPFWLTAISFWIFGVNDFAYKLPGLICSGLSIYFTWKSARLLFGRSVANTSALVLLSSFHFLLNINDVRAEPYLIAFITGSFYYFICWTKTQQLKFIALCGVLSACAFMTKGLFALIPILGVMFGFLLANLKDWIRLFTLLLWWAFCVFIALTPSLLAYWLQFDRFPEKTSNLLNIGEQTQVSGIKFFLWDSQIGRFFNDGPIQTKDTANPLYFVNAMIWAFWPWTLFWFAGIAVALAKIKQLTTEQGYLIWGSLPLFALFSASSFQLPHYVVTVFPFFAMATAYLIHNHPLSESKWLHRLNYVLAGLIILIVILASALINDLNPQVIGLVTVITVVSLLAKTLLKLNHTKFLVVLALMHNSLLVSLFYPQLLNYQSAVTTAKVLKQQNQEKLPIYSLWMGRISLEYRLNHEVNKINDPSQFTPPAILLTNAKGYNIAQSRMNYELLSEHCDYPVTRLTSEFLFPQTRSKKCKTRYLLKVNSFKPAGS